MRLLRSDLLIWPGGHVRENIMSIAEQSAPIAKFRGSSGRFCRSGLRSWRPIQSPTIVSSAIRKAKDFASLSADDLGLALNSFVSRISVLSDRIAITIHPDKLAAWILGASMAQRDDGQKTTIITAPIKPSARARVFIHEYTALVRRASFMLRSASHEA
jgi:hypothetical protein